jgi:hypothetical protein
VHLSPKPCRFAIFCSLLLLCVTLAGCGMFRADAAIGPDLKPRLDTSISMPLGK